MRWRNGQRSNKQSRLLIYAARTPAVSPGDQRSELTIESFCQLVVQAFSMSVHGHDTRKSIEPDFPESLGQAERFLFKHVIYLCHRPGVVYPRPADAMQVNGFIFFKACPLSVFDDRQRPTKLRGPRPLQQFEYNHLRRADHSPGFFQSTQTDITV